MPQMPLIKTHNVFLFVHLEIYIDRITLLHFGFSKIKVQPCNISSWDTEGPYVGATCAWAQTLS